MYPDLNASDHPLLKRLALPIALECNAAIKVASKTRRWLAAVFTRATTPNFKVGHRFLVEGFVPRISAKGEIIAGHGFYVRSPTRAAEIHVGRNARLVIGNDVLLNDGASITARVGIAIGSNCLIGPNVAIMDTNFHQVDEGSEIVSGPIVIEDNVWIGRGATVLPSVRIGRNSVIGAGAVVTRSVPRNSLAAGVPAVVKRELNASPQFIRR